MQKPSGIWYQEASLFICAKFTRVVNFVTHGCSGFNYIPSTELTLSKSSNSYVEPNDQCLHPGLMIHRQQIESQGSTKDKTTALGVHHDCTKVPRRHLDRYCTTNTCVGSRQVAAGHLAYNTMHCCMCRLPCSISWYANLSTFTN